MASILIAEDDNTMRHFLTQALIKAGHDVEACDNGRHALDALLKYPASGRSLDLLVADIVMPGMDGIELSRKATAAIPDLKVLYITGFVAIAPQNQGQGSEAPQILSKPFHLKDLVDRVETILTA